MIDVVYDTEIFPNVFTVQVTPLDAARDDMWVYELSARRNDAAALYRALTEGHFKRMFGFNNIGFDYPLLDLFLKCHVRGMDYMEIVAALWMKCCAIIDSGKFDERTREHLVKPWEIVVPQVDLYKMHHFDNRAKRTGLKTLEFNMRSPSVEEMPFEPGTYLTPDQIAVLVEYGCNDTRETKRFAHRSAGMIAFREAVASRISGDVMNMNDTKIGKSFFIQQMEKRKPGVCYNADRSPRQTIRDVVRLGDVVLPYISFERPEFQNVVNWLRDQVIHQTKGVFPDLHAVVDGFRFDFGTGGLHGSVSDTVVKADAEHAIVDIDVEGYYPSIAIANNLSPAHLGSVFCEVYRDNRDTRSRAKRLAKDKSLTPAEREKWAVEAGTLKLANNGVFGDTNNPYSPFLDAAYTMSITVNGQLMLCMLAEKLMAIPGLQMIQANTDGITVRVPRAGLDTVASVCSWWDWATGLTLEFNRYSRMWVRDVNNYLAETTSGEIKRKGVYDYEMLSGSTGGQLAWNRNFSGLVIKRAAEAAMIHDQDPEDFISHHAEIDPWDFMLRAKVDRRARLELSDGTPLQRTVRYFIGTSGHGLVKIMAPLGGKQQERRMMIHAEGQASCSGKRSAYTCSVCGTIFPTKGAFELHNKDKHSWPVQIRNVFTGDITGVDLRYYIQEAEKLVLA